MASHPSSVSKAVRPNHALVAAGVCLCLLAMAVATLPVAGAADPSSWQWEDEEVLTTASDYRERPRIAAWGDQAYAVWTEWGVDTDVYFRQYNGTAWEDRVVVAVEKGEAYQGQIDVAASDGVAHMVWVDARDGDNDVFYRSKTPQGWTSAVELSSDASGTSRSSPSVAADGRRVHVVWTENDGGGWELVYRAFDGEAWGVPAVLSSNNEKEPRIAADNGRVHVAWMRDGFDKDIFYIGHDGKSWGSVQELSVDALSEDQEEPHIAADGDAVHVVWYQGEQFAWQVLITSNTGDGWTTPVELGQSEPAGGRWHPGVAAEGGRIYVVYKIQAHPFTMLLRYFNGTAWSDEVDVSPNRGSLPPTDASITTHQGRLHLLYNDHISEFHLYLVHRMAQVDVTPPTSGVIDADPDWMDGTGTTVNWSASDDFGLASVRLQYRFSEDRGEWTAWEDHVTEVATGTYVRSSSDLVPPGGEGFYELRTVAEDRVGNVQVLVEPTTLVVGYDVTPPNGSLTPAEEGILKTAFVDLDLTYDDATSGVDKMRLSNDGVWDTEEWMDPAGTLGHVLPETSGNHTVHLQLRDVAGLLSEVYTASVEVDLDAPTGSIAIADGAAATGLTLVTLQLDYDDVGSGVDKVRFSNDGEWDTEEWEAPAGTKAWELPGGDGTKTVWYQIRDLAGWTSEAYSDDIVLDTDPASVGDQEPEDGATDVAANASIVVTFDEPMDTDSVEAALSVQWEDPDGGWHDVPGQVSWDPDGRVMTFMPIDPVGKGSRVRVEVGSGAQDAAGNGLDPTVSFTYTVEEDDGDGGDDGDDLYSSPIPWVLLAVAVVFVIAVYGMAARGRKPA